MRKAFLLLLLTAISACSSSPARNENTADKYGNELVMYAMSLVDTPYRYGGDDVSTGFDCSGYVGHVYYKVLGIRLPRTSREISTLGRPLRRSELRPGDLVFFNTRRSPYSHVGLYIGDGKFVHAPRSGTRIRVEDMGLSYWKTRYNGARRIR